MNITKTQQLCSVNCSIPQFMGHTVTTCDFPDYYVSIGGFCASERKKFQIPYLNKKCRQ